MLTYTSVDRILGALYRDLGDMPFEEDDIIEYIGEALGFLQVYPSLEHTSVDLDVRDNRVQLPKDIAVIDYIQDISDGEIEPKCKCQDYEDILSNGARFLKKASIKSKTKCGDTKIQYSGEYSIEGIEDKELFVSFKDGRIRIAYSRAVTDSNGYPMIPDNSDFISAILYYVKWKISEAMSWRGRDGYSNLLQYARNEWLRYAKQAKNWAKMPKTAEEWQGLMEQQYNMIPDLTLFYKGFSGINRKQRWND